MAYCRVVNVTPGMQGNKGLADWDITLKSVKSSCDQSAGESGGASNS